MYQHNVVPDSPAPVHPHGYQQREIPAASTTVTSKHPDPSFPQALSDDAYHGIIGEVVRTIEPHTEANNAALLLMALAACGAVFGRNPYYVADGSRHGTNLFTCIVGDSGKARKGTAWAWIKRIITKASDEGFEKRIESGLSSGEGLINLVRDANEQDEDDIGVTDKRLLAVQSEFSSVMKVMSREGNNLSEILREAWDGGRLRTATRNNPLSATKPHIAIIGHVTRDELLRTITNTEAANGWGNRILWAAAHRSKFLPLGGDLQESELTALVERLKQSFAMHHAERRYQFDTQAREAWIAIYPDLSKGKAGLLGAMVNRGEAQVIRLALVYSALDRADGLIRLPHLTAALAVWEYCEASARWIFGERLGDPLADSIMKALDASKHGMTRTDINSYLGRNTNAARIAVALQMLLDGGRARCEHIPPPDGIGRPTEKWFSCTKETNFTK